MPKPPWEVADIFRQYGTTYRQTHRLPLPLLRVMQAIETCRTAALGGHIERCPECRKTQISYNSCRNRHCPKCQAATKARWLEKRLDELLPVEYFHVVFTVPESVSRLGLQNKRLLYDLLFQTTAKTMRTIAADPKHLGAEVGFMAVLHSWGQTLCFHPHLHCIVPGGGFNSDGKRWIACRPGFFLPVRVLSRYFRRVFLEALRQAHRKDKLVLKGPLRELRDFDSFQQWIQALLKVDWVVYAKPPFGGPEKVLDYLGRYTHRVAIANHRLVDVANGKVTFHWRDYRHQSRKRKMTLDTEEFIRRFLMHVLPTGFVRIRYFGFLANRYRAKKIEMARALLRLRKDEASESRSGHEEKTPNWRLDSHLCPHCRRGQLICVETLAPVPECTVPVQAIDSS